MKKKLLLTMSILTATATAAYADDMISSAYQFRTCYHLKFNTNGLSPATGTQYTVYSENKTLVGSGVLLNSAPYTTIDFCDFNKFENYTKIQDYDEVHSPSHHASGVRNLVNGIPSNQQQKQSNFAIYIKTPTQKGINQISKIDLHVDHDFNFTPDKNGEGMKLEKAEHTIKTKFTTNSTIQVLTDGGGPKAVVGGAVWTGINDWTRINEGSNRDQMSLHYANPTKHYNFGDLGNLWDSQYDSDGYRPRIMSTLENYTFDLSMNANPFYLVNPTETPHITTFNQTIDYKTNSHVISGVLYNLAPGGKIDSAGGNYVTDIPHAAKNLATAPTDSNGEIYSGGNDGGIVILNHATVLNNRRVTSGTWLCTGFDNNEVDKTLNGYCFIDAKGAIAQYMKPYSFSYAKCNRDSRKNIQVTITSDGQGLECGTEPTTPTFKRDQTTTPLNKICSQKSATSDCPPFLVGIDTSVNSVISDNGNYKLFLEQSGHLVIYNKLKTSVWAAPTGSAGAQLWLDSTGNLIAYDVNHKVAWETATRDSGADKLVMQDDGNLVLYRGTTPVWASNTVGR